MDPMTIAALISGGGGVLSSILGGNADSSTNATNLAIAQMNKQEQDQARQEAIQFATKQQDNQNLGATNAQGDRSYFKPGVGWVTDLSSKDQGLLNYFYSQELPQQQSQVQRNADASRSQSDEANQLLAQFQREGRLNPTDIENQLYLKGTEGIGDNTRDAEESALRAALRSGSSNVGKIAAAIAKTGSQARADTAINSKLQADGYVDNKYNSDRSNLDQLYASFADRAAKPIGSSIDPANITQPANSQANVASNQAQQGSSQVLNAMEQPVATMPMQQPDYGPANAIGGAAASLGGIANAYGTSQNNDATNELLRSYITGGGQLDLGQGGLFGAIADRVRTTGSGTF